jgi:hypothetical protein
MSEARFTGAAAWSLGEVPKGDHALVRHPARRAFRFGPVQDRCACVVCVDSVRPFESDKLDWPVGSRRGRMPQPTTKSCLVNAVQFRRKSLAVPDVAICERNVPHRRFGTRLSEMRSLDLVCTAHLQQKPGKTRSVVAIGYRQRQHEVGTCFVNE